MPKNKINNLMMEKDDNNARVERGREIKRKRESAREKRDE